MIIDHLNTLLVSSVFLEREDILRSGKESRDPEMQFLL